MVRMVFSLSCFLAMYINLFFYNPFNIFDRFVDIEVAVANGIVDGVESVVCAIDVYNERLFADG